jgi:hypothetical protein
MHKAVDAVFWASFALGLWLVIVVVLELGAMRKRANEPKKRRRKGKKRRLTRAR